MNIFNVKRNNLKLILLPIVMLLISSIFYLSKSEDKSLKTNTNITLPVLSEKNKVQFNTKAVTDSIYSAKFYEDNFERNFILIRKKPTYRSFYSQVNVFVYPKDTLKYKTAKNYNLGYLDFSSTLEPIKYHYNYEEYSVLKINLPFIEIDKIDINQKYEWHKSYKNPFKTNIQKSRNPYQIVLLELLKKENIVYFDNESINVMSVLNKKLFWTTFFKNSKGNYTKYFKVKGKNKIEINKMLSDFYIGKKQFNEVFNIQKLTSYLAIMNLFGNSKNIKLEFILQNNLLEPYYNNDEVGVLNTYLIYNYIDDLNFQKNYLLKLNEFSNINIENLINNTPNLSDNIKTSNTIDPSKIFKKSLFYHNQMVIKKDINPAIGLKATFLERDKNKFTVSIKNLSFSYSSTRFNVQKEKINKQI